MDFGDVSPFLTTLAYGLPSLLAGGIALAMLATAARSSHERKLGLIGVGAMLTCSIIELCLSLYQTYLITGAARNSESAADLNRSIAVLGSAHMLLHLMYLGGLLLVVWALCRATRRRAEPPLPP